MDQKPQGSGQRAGNAPAKRPPLYELGKEGHYGACLQVYNQGQAPNPDSFTGNWANINQGLTGNHREILSSYWQQQLRSIEDDDHDYKNNHLPLARIKKVMKADPEVKMISAEAPILFAKGCDIFITEVTMRAWIHAEENKRRTLQRSDIASALMKSDMYDFLIDIVPREDATGSSHSKRPAGQPSTTAAAHPQTQQAPVSQQAPPQHAPAPGYGGFPPPMGAENDYRAPSLYVPHGQADPAYGHPQQQMFDSSMYSGYPMPPQQIPYPIQRPQVLNQGLDPNRHHYRSHEAGEADAESDRDFVVG